MNVSWVYITWVCMQNVTIYLLNYILFGVVLLIILLISSGLNAGDIMQGFVLALKLKAKKSDMDSMYMMHPTGAECFSRMTKTLEETDFVLSSTC